MNDEAEGVQTLAGSDPAPAPERNEDDERREAAAIEAYQKARDAERLASTFPVRDKEFVLKPKIAAAVLLDLAVVGDKRTPQVEQLRAMRSFIDEVVDDEDAAEFHQLLRSAEPPIEFEELGDIIQAMVEKISSRPTEQPSA